ncbi:MAG TPA: hypothetical protein VIV40_31445, partial [Kofleriaceae bacterium]
LTELQRGYEILLGRPLDTFESTARYELWFFVDSELLPEHERVPALTLEQLVVGRPNAPAAAQDTKAGEFWQRCAVDYARTLFVYDKHDLPEDAPDALLADLQRHQYALTGEELARVVERNQLELDDVLATCWYACRRAVTDGSLVDAMAAATLSASVPAGMLSRAQFDNGDDIRFEPRWEHALRVIRDETLREHLLMSCVDLQTARWAGAWLDPKHKPDVWLEPVVRRGGEILSIWHSGEGQATRAVVKLAARAAPVMELAADESMAFPIGGGLERRKKR